MILLGAAAWDVHGAQAQTSADLPPAGAQPYAAIIPDGAVPEPNPLLFSSGAGELFPLTVRNDTGAANPTTAENGVSNPDRDFKPLSQAATHVMDIDTGFNHTCAVTQIGGVKCWGQNGYYQLGDGTMQTRATPVDVIGLSEDIEAVTTAGTGTCALTVSGGVKCWGATVTSGDGTVPPPYYRNGIKDVVGLSSGVQAIDAGANHVCALMDDGGVKCWGDNTYGQLGNGSTAPSYTPVDVSGLAGNAVAISAGQHHTCAITFIGGIKCWGYNAGYQLGDGTQVDSPVPVDVLGFDAVAIGLAAGSVHTCAIKAAGGVMCWGMNNYGQLGNGEGYYQTAPVDVINLGGAASAITAGFDHTCAMFSSGGVQCWGRNVSGAVGIGTYNNNQLTPMNVVGLAGGAAVLAGGYQYTCAATTNGGAMCWGFNQGRLGDGQGWDRYSPVSVVGLGLKKWTVMVYMGGDGVGEDSPEPYAIDNFLEMAAVGSDINLNILVQLDRVAGYDSRYDDWTNTRRFYVTQGMEPISDNGISIGEADMGDPTVLSSFIQWSKDRYPAEHYFLILYGHGTGFHVVTDDTPTEDYDELGLWDLRSALNTVTNGGIQPLDFIAMDACIMANIETASQLIQDAGGSVFRPYAKLFIASQDVIKLLYGFDYTFILDDLQTTPDKSLELLAREFIDNYNGQLISYTLSAVDLGSPYDSLITAVDDFALALIDEGAPYMVSLQAYRFLAQEFGEMGAEPFVDLHKFAEGVHGLPNQRLHDTAEAVMTAIGDSDTPGDAVVYEADDYLLGLGPHGISIYFPDTQDLYISSYDGDQDFLRFSAITNWDEWLHDYYNDIPEPPEDFGMTAPAAGSNVPVNPMLSWAASSRAVSYEYCYDTTDNLTCDGSWVSTGVATVAVLSGLSPDTTYYWMVRAVNTYGSTEANGGVWWSLTALLPGPFEKTAPPDGSVTGTSPTISWTASSGADGYEICYDAIVLGECSTAWESVGAVTSVALPTFYSPNIEWQVRAVHDGEYTYADDGAWWTFHPSALPESFGKTAPADGAPASLMPYLSWEAAVDADSYELCYDTTDDDACAGAWENIGESPSTFIGELSPTTTYYWQVRAVNVNGNTEADGGTWWSFTTIAAPPGDFGKTAPAVDAVVTTNPTLSWSTSSRAESYEYCYDTTDDSSCGGSWSSAGTATSASLSDLAAGTAYYWQVRAVNGEGDIEADSGGWWRFTTTSAPPAAFGKAEPADGAPASLYPYLTWNASSTADGYEICFDTSDNDACNASWADAGNNTFAFLSDLSPETTYYWQARAVNAVGTTEADGGSWWSFTTIAAPPGDFGKTAPDIDATVPVNPTLSWGASSRAESYEYCYDTTDDFSCDGPWFSAGTAVSIGVSGLSYDTTYFWQVRAVNAEGTTEADSGSWWSFITIAAPPGAFGKSSPPDTDYASTSPTISWDAAAGAGYYEYCLDIFDNDSCDGSWTSAGSSTSAGLSGLSTATTYYWQVRAVNPYGSTEADGGAWWSFTTQAGDLPAAFGKIAPADASAVPPNPTLEWATGSGAESYELCYDTTDDDTCDGSWLPAGMATSAPLSGLTLDTTYYWQVRAVNFNGSTEADGGAWWSFTTQQTPPAAFGKTAPADGGTASTSPRISWADSSNAFDYEYCYDTTDDDGCDGSWTMTGLYTYVDLTGLAEGTTYYWQARAIGNGGTTYSDGGAWWSFTTASTALPGAFGKTTPIEASIVSTSPTLQWNASTGAESYEYCYDTTDNDSCDGSWFSAGLATSAALSGLAADADYYWQVRAVNFNGSTEADDGAWSGFHTVPPPAAFGKATPPDGGSWTVDLWIGWYDTSGAYGYEYCIDTTDDDVCDGAWTSVGLDSYAHVTGVLPDTTYYWQVRALGDGGVTYADGGAWWSLITDLPLPGAFGKTGPADASSTTTSPTLEWSASDGATSYNYCIDTTDDSHCDGAWFGNGTSTSISPTGLTGGITYYWQIHATNGNGTTEADGGTWWSFTTDGGLPGAFAKTSPADSSTVSTSPTLQWTASAGVDHYSYCIDTTDNSACDDSWYNVGTSTSVPLTGLAVGATYYWQVLAENSEGTTVADGGTWHSFTVVAPPAAFNKTAPFNSGTASVDPRISWDSAGGSFDYEYCVDMVDNDSCDGSWTATGLYTYVDLSGLAVDTTYFWQVRALGDGGVTDADDGDWWSFTTVPLPGAFAKSSPADASYALTSPTLLWGASAGAATYEYCIDTSNNGTCDASWVSAGAATGIALSGLGNNDAYYWQVRALNGAGATYADGGTWRTFTARRQTFADVPITHSLWAYVDAFYASGITGGCGVSPLIFCPENNVTRAAMAVFLLRAKYGAGYTPPAARHFFSDLPVAGKEWQEAWVDEFYSQGITGGCGTAPLRFCPENPVTRAAMAVFILRAIEGSTYAPPAASHFFADLPVAGKEWQEAWVDELYRRGITTGCGTGPLIYCPENPVKRQAMAAFIVRAFNLPLP
jgi:alpha-tubulin suppressor-like RCC1 family protein